MSQAMQTTPDPGGSGRGGSGRGWLTMIGPGVLIAATGVGAGDLATAAFSGSHLGLAVLWAVAAGAALKFVLNEGLARWQLASGETWLEGILTRFGRPVRWLFLTYLVLWSWFVGSALMGACGVTAHALVPLGLSPEQGKLAFGVVHAVAGLGLVWFGGFEFFKRMMSVCIGIMFATALVTAVLLKPDWSEVLRGLLIPRIPDGGGEGLAWTIALIGGVGGTLTTICYGYWIREHGRQDPSDLRACRVDLFAGYTATALFGIAMVIIGSRVVIEGKGAGLVIELGATLEEPLGTAAKWIFLVGAWGAVFSSLLGVWQAVPYIFADYVRITGDPQSKVTTTSPAYRGYLLGIALIPITGLWFGFQSIQKAYAVIGAAFLPLLALSLVFLCGRRWLEAPHRNRPLTQAVLWLGFAFFAAAGAFDLIKRF